MGIYLKSISQHPNCSLTFYTKSRQIHYVCNVCQHRYSTYISYHIHYMTTTYIRICIVIRVRVERVNPEPDCCV